MKGLKHLIRGTDLTPLTIALSYCIFGLLWFYIADSLLNGMSAKMEMLKDFSFIILTSIIIYLFVNKKSSALNRVQEQLRAIIRRTIGNKEADNEHIANQIQNEFNQELAAIKIQLTALKARYIKSPEEFDKYLAAETETISAGINQLIKKFRKFTEELRPEVLEDLDLRDSIDWLASDHFRRTGIKTVFDTNISEFMLDKKKSVNIFRILQEAIVFLERPDKIELKAVPGKKAFTFAVSFFNNSKELFPVAQHEIKLLSLRERIAMVEGNLTEIKSEKGLFRISFYVPKANA